MISSRCRLSQVAGSWHFVPTPAPRKSQTAKRPLSTFSKSYSAQLKAEIMSCLRLGFSEGQASTSRTKSGQSLTGICVNICATGLPPLLQNPRIKTTCKSEAKGSTPATSTIFTQACLDEKMSARRSSKSEAGRHLKTATSDSPSGVFLWTDFDTFSHKFLTE